MESTGIVLGLMIGVLIATVFSGVIIWPAEKIVNSIFYLRVYER